MFISCFANERAAIGLEPIDGGKKWKIATAFCSTSDKFNRNKATMIIENRAKSDVKSKYVFVLDNDLSATKQTVAISDLIDAFKTAVEHGNARYNSAKVIGKFPLPSRANTINELFVKLASIIKVKEAQVA